ncbi:hypothetical protein AWB69_02768 [Caballeronia udeis]|uniref:Uncharacterized protein n=1 Tax=Caballeronia udeis TaxID=1232866 RepID=A0A158GK07_9BURK|nr:hypothetical protein AWB69_02768 [Caballeronia udeis]
MFLCKLIAKLNVNQAPNAAPHHGIAGRRVVGPCKVTTELRKLDEAGGGARVVRGVSLTIRSRSSTSVCVRANWAGAWAAHRLSMVSQKIRQLRIQNTEMRLAKRSAVRNFDSSVSPDFRILWKVSIFQRIAYQSSFSMASARDLIDRSVINFHSSEADRRERSFPEHE